MATKDAPTRELGTPGGIFPAWGTSQPAGTSYYLDGLETNTDLRFPLSAGIYDRMRREDGKISSSYRAIITPIMGTRARLVGDDVRPEVLALCELELGLEEEAKGKARRRRQGIVFREHLRQALLMLAHGFMAFEQVYEVGPATPDYVARFPQAKGELYAHLRKLGPRMPRTISEVRVDRDGGLAGIVQHVADMSQTSGGMPGTVFVPTDRLVWYVNEKEGSDWTGQSVLRAAYKHWLIKDVLVRLDAQIVERNGMGIPIVSYDPANPNGRSEALELARSVRAGAESGGALPHGTTLSLVGVAGSTVDPLPKIKYHDQAAAESMLQHFLTLGHDNGARSLGDTFVDFFLESLKTIVANIEDTATEHIIRDLVEWNYGPDEAYPSLKFEDISSEAAPTAEALKTLSDAGLIEKTRDLKVWTHARYGLPDIPDEEVIVEPVAPQVAPDPDGADVVEPGAELAADPAGYKAETEKIRANRRTAAARGPHRFKAAQWTHPNGHPRCILCGSEERIGGQCVGADKDGLTTSAPGSRGVAHASAVDGAPDYLARVAALNEKVLALHQGHPTP